MGRAPARRVVRGPSLRSPGRVARAPRRALAGAGDDRRGARAPAAAGGSIDGDGRDRPRRRSGHRRRALRARQLALLPIRSEGAGPAITRPPRDHPRGAAGRAPSASTRRIGADRSPVSRVGARDGKPPRRSCARPRSPSRVAAAASASPTPGRVSASSRPSGWGSCSAPLTPARTSMWCSARSRASPGGAS